MQNLHPNFMDEYVVKLNTRFAGAGKYRVLQKKRETWVQKLTETSNLSTLECLGAAVKKPPFLRLTEVAHNHKYTGVEWGHHPTLE